MNKNFSPNEVIFKKYIETSLALFILKTIDQLGLSKGLFGLRQKKYSPHDTFHTIASNNIRYIVAKTNPKLPMFFHNLIKAEFQKPPQPYEIDDFYLHIMLEVIEPLLSRHWAKQEVTSKTTVSGTAHDTKSFGKDYCTSISGSTANNEKQRHTAKTDRYQIKDENSKRLNVNSETIKVELSALLPTEGIASEEAIRYAESVLNEIDKQKYFEWELVRINTTHKGVLVANSENAAKKRLRELFNVTRLPNGYRLRQISKQVYERRR